MKKVSEFPGEWDKQRVRNLLSYYESQSDQEAAAGHEAALSRPDSTLMEMPTELVPAFRQIIAEHQRGGR